LERIIAPPCFPGGHRALGELTAKICESLGSQLDKQASSVPTRGILAEDDLTLSVIDLADLSCAVAFVPTLFEAERLDVEARRAIHVRHEEAGRVYHRCTVWLVEVLFVKVSSLI
jgi:hypothetical protein